MWLHYLQDPAGRSHLAVHHDPRAGAADRLFTELFNLELIDSVSIEPTALESAEPGGWLYFPTQYFKILILISENIWEHF